MTVQLATGRYATFDRSMGIPVGITLGRPKFPIRYTIAAEIDELKPWGLLGVQDPAEFTRLYRQRLDRLDLGALVQKFEAISAQQGGRRCVLLCYENVHAGQPCHRRVFAEWFEERTDQRVPELNLAKTPPQPLRQLRLAVADQQPASAPGAGRE